jgi:anthranilate phosphoribosyltransferase
MLKDAISDVSQRRDLSRERIAGVFEEIFAGNASPAQVGALLVALRMKGETVEEVTGAALALRRRAIVVPTPEGQTVLDTCGTGGDGRGTFNVSTTVAFVAAAAGVTVAKHGNARVSSQCGSADVLGAAGVNLDAPIATVERCLREVGVAFLLAPLFHPVMKHVAVVRRELGVRSIFNILGPLANPARADRQLVGVYDRALLPSVAGALAELGTVRSLVVHGDDGLDEVSPCGLTHAILVESGRTTPMRIVPSDARVEPVAASDLTGGSPEENAGHLRAVLEGRRGALREAVVLNAAAALWVSGVVKDLPSGADAARRLLDDGSALAKLDALVAMSRAS